MPWIVLKVAQAHALVVLRALHAVVQMVFTATLKPVRSLKDVRVLSDPNLEYDRISDHATMEPEHTDVTPVLRD